MGSFPLKAGDTQVVLLLKFGSWLALPLLDRQNILPCHMLREHTQLHTPQLRYEDAPLKQLAKAAQICGIFDSSPSKPPKLLVHGDAQRLELLGLLAE